LGPQLTQFLRQRLQPINGMDGGGTVTSRLGREPAIESSAGSDCRRATQAPLDVESASISPSCDEENARVQAQVGLKSAEYDGESRHALQRGRHTVPN